MMETGILCLVACLSLSLTLFVAYTIFKNKKLRNIHPAKLIGVLSLCEFCTCWVVMWHTIGPVRMTCYTGINYSYLWTIQWIIPSYTMEQAIKDIVGWPLQLYDVCQMASLFLNGYFCLDLYLTFRNPFYPNGRRLSWYFSGTIFFVILFKTLTTGVIMVPDKFFSEYITPILADNSKAAA